MSGAAVLCAGRCGRSAPGAAGPPGESAGRARDARPGRCCGSPALWGCFGKAAAPKVRGEARGSGSPSPRGWGPSPPGLADKGPGPAAAPLSPLSKGPLSAGPAPFPGRGGTAAKRIVPPAQPCRGRTTDVRLRFSLSPKLFSPPGAGSVRISHQAMEGKVTELNSESRQ